MREERVSAISIGQRSSFGYWKRVCKKYRMDRSYCRALADPETYSSGDGWEECS